MRVVRQLPEKLEMMRFAVTTPGEIIFHDMLLEAAASSSAVGLGCWKRPSGDHAHDMGPGMRNRVGPDHLAAAAWMPS